MSVADEEGLDREAPPTEETLLDTLVDALRGFKQVAQASLTLLRSELRLARSSALTLIWLAFAFIILGAGIWLTTIAAIVTGIYQLSGNIFLGVAIVALANLVGLVWVILVMRRCWRDLSLPQTRALVLSTGPKTIDEKTTAIVREEP